MSRITINSLEAKKKNNAKFACVTAYDASFAKLVAGAEIETLLIGDSLGNVIQGEETTVPVTLEEMAYHVNCVARGLIGEENHPLLIADMPFMSYSTAEQALDTAADLMQAGAQVVKLEGGDWLLDSVHLLSERGINVCGHLGLTPQTVDSLGGFKVQGKTPETAKNILNQAVSLQDAGARMLVVECVPIALGKQITEALEIPVIGIGAGPFTDSQVLVLYDLLGISPGRKPRFVKDFLTGNNDGISGALSAFREAIISGSYPEKHHCFE
ncbi:3-methyl-2-oxobutanoate hydroxymethyltransferase [Candidatus Dependentiae bacterium]|nr:MAG: 3-methyl-2-oxobutanoate hydroxymethyltransferase [Candidatus Dependentiae bacterium]